MESIIRMTDVLFQSLFGDGGNSRNPLEPEQSAMKQRLTTDYRNNEFLALDLELSSLNANEGDIISIGYVPVIGGEIVPSVGKHFMISDHNGVGESAEFHGIRDCDSEAGIPLADALHELVEDSKGKVLVLHHASLDLGFLKKVGVTYPKDQIIDTLNIEKKRLGRQQHAIGANQLRLFQCRERYNLPNRKAHNAYVDALATAELFLAQAAHIAGEQSLPVKELIKMSR